MAEINKTYSFALINRENFRFKIQDGETPTVLVSGTFTIGSITSNFTTDSNGFSPWIYIDALDSAININIPAIGEFEEIDLNHTFSGPNQQITIQRDSPDKGYIYQTTKPLNRFFNELSEKEYIYLIIVRDNLPLFSQRVVFQDNTTETTTTNISTLQKGNSYQFPIDLKSILESTQETIKRIEFFINEDEIITYQYQACRTDTPVTLYYRTSLGGFDSLTCEGVTTEQINYSSIQTKTELIPNFSVDFSQTSNVSNTSFNQFTFNTGYKTIGEISALKDLFHHNDIYLLSTTNSDKILIPLHLKNKTQPLSSNRNNLQSLTFTAIERLNKPYR